MAYLNLSKIFIFDPLSIFFLAVIVIVSLPSAVYSIGYLRGETTVRKTFLAWILLAFFIVSMGLVVSVRNIFLFLVAWEIMSLVSYFLVIFDTKSEKSIQAGTIYIIMTHIGTAFLVAAFMMMYKCAHSFDFMVVKNACLSMPTHERSIIFTFLLIGFGTKAGIVPLHIWLPYAHPQAPSHISSIMSGVMIKTAVYGMIRFIIYILGPGDRWWGISILAFAVITCLVGVIYALMERDIKKLLAYSSVENMGIILLGVGLSIYFLSVNIPYLAVFSMVAGLYHLINHAIFKALLFLCAGSVYKATGTRNIEKLGGLIKKMPQTAVYFLIGAMAISALPLLNGFVSEWLTLQAFFMGVVNASGASRIFLIVCAGALALTLGLASACFVRAFGITFLAKGRTHHSLNAKEVSLSMRSGMFFLSGLCIIFGLGAAYIIKILASVAGEAAGINISAMKFSLNNFALTLQPGRGVYLSTPILAGVLAILAITAFATYKMIGRGRRVVYNTWDCGYYKLDSRNEYTATAFSKPFRIVFSFFLLPFRKTQKIRDSFYHVKSFNYETRTTKIFIKYVYEPALSLIIRLAKFMRKIQPGSIHLYLSYIFAALLLLIFFVNKF